ncbi:MAG: SCO family protein [Gammaproteobacteria bacterium]|nr:SCO family protein [Gammaproteobacteria bacterium]
MSKLLTIAIALTAAIAGVGLYMGLGGSEGGSTQQSQRLQATSIPNSQPLKSFTLRDHKGEVFDRSRLEGKWTFLFFGYTHCPDVCPTTLATLTQVDEQLKSSSSGLSYQVVFVSVDPQRDSQERLAEYIPYFNEKFIGVRGETSELDKITRQLGVMYARVDEEGRPADAYLVDHTASIVLIDPAGRFKAVFGAPHNAPTMTSDFQVIASGSQG